MVRFKLFTIAIIVLLLYSCEYLQKESDRKLLFNRDNEIWLYDLKTRKLKKLVALHELVYKNEQGTSYFREWAGGAKWSPDGKNIVFKESVGTDAQYMKLMNMETQKQEFFPNYIYRQDGSVEWSADGKQLVFSQSIASLGLNYELFIINGDRKGETQLTDRPFHTDHSASLHPNGVDILFDSFFSGIERDTILKQITKQIYHTTVYGDSVTQITFGEKAMWSPRINPRTGEILYGMKDPERGLRGIWKVADMDFSGPVKLSDSDYAHSSGYWSNDGELIVFVRFAGGTHGPYTNPEIWMMNADGSDKKLIIKNGSGPSLWVNN